MSLTGYKSYNNSNLQGNNTTDQQIAAIESDLDVVEANKISERFRCFRRWNYK